MTRFQARRRNGRFTRNTLANTCGLRVEPCPNRECRALNPYAVGAARPTHCHQCGTLLTPREGETR